MHLIAWALVVVLFRWNWTASLRIARDSARHGTGVGYPVLAHALLSLLVLAGLTGVMFARADALELPPSWWMVAVTFAAPILHGLALVAADRRASAHREQMVQRRAGGGFSGTISE